MLFDVNLTKLSEYFTQNNFNLVLYISKNIIYMHTDADTHLYNTYSAKIVAVTERGSFTPITDF